MLQIYLRCGEGVRQWVSELVCSGIAHVLQHTCRSFGVVCEARCLETGEVVAIKKVLQDPRYKNRELDVMRMLKHPNIVSVHVSVVHMVANRWI